MRERTRGETGGAASERESGDRWPGRRTLTGSISRPVQMKSASGADAHGSHHEHDLEEGGTETEEAVRFTGDDVLKEVAAGTKTLALGDKGPAVLKVQIALHDLRFSISRHGTFTAETETVVKELQKKKGIAESGKVDKATIDEIEAAFATKKPYADFAKSTAPGLKATEGVEWDAKSPPTPLDNYAATLSDDQKAAVQDALSPSAKVGGVMPAFKPDVGGEKYEKRLEKLLDTKILEQWDRVAKGKSDAHKDASKLFTLDKAEDVGEYSKKATDKVYGSWAQSAPMKAGVNLKDKFAVEDDEIGKMSAAEKHATAEWRVEKIIRTDTAVAALNKEHNVDRSRSTEEGLIDAVKSALATKYEEKLLEIQRAWPASADTSKREVFLQLFKGKDDAENRDVLWRMFGTLVHEYIHTLEHSEWRKWRDAEGAKDSSKGQTLTEGVTELLTRIVLADLGTPDETMRKGVEGTYFDERAPAPKIERKGYQADADRAEKVVGIVGVSNLYNAYFVGQTQFMGA